MSSPPRPEWRLGPLSWIPGALSLGVKLTTHFHLVPGSRKAWNCASAPPIRLHGVGAQLNKSKMDKFTLLY